MQNGGSTPVATNGRASLVGDCRFWQCKEQHLHPVTGDPPSYHFVDGEGVPQPRWPDALRRGADPLDWWYRLGEVAKTCGVHINTVRRWVRERGLKATRPGGGVWLVRGRDLDAWLRSNERGYQSTKDPVR